MSKQYKNVTWARPGEPGFDPHQRYPWSAIGEIAGLSKDVNVQIDGFYLIDNRTNPPTAIFSNIQFPIVVDVRPCLSVMPEPWRSPGAAVAHLKTMHLSAEEEELCRHRKGPVQICAMAQDPGLGIPKPNVLILDKKAAKAW